MMNDRDKEWVVKVVEDATGEVVKSIPSRSEREAERVERGIDINLDHSRFTCYTDTPNN